MKKFSRVIDDKKSISFDKKNQNNLSNDIDDLNDQIISNINSTKLEGEWEIVNIIDVSKNEPVNEAIVINAELGGKDVKRGDFLYITALLNKKGSYTHQNQMGVIKVRIVELYNTLLVLNSIK